VLLAGACGKKGTTATSTTKAGATPGATASPTGGAAKSGGTFRQPIGEPKAIDPYASRESEGINVTRALFVGLVSLDNKTAEIKPALAESMNANTDCTEWTFKIKKGTKFSNGEEVTAQSFIDGWTRAAGEKAASAVASHMSGIVGYKELHGKKDTPATATTFSGLSAPDPNTLVVKLSPGDCEFDKKVLHSVFSPVPKDAGAFDNKTYNEAPIGNGPFMIKPGTKWEHDKSISLVKNPTYTLGTVYLDAVEYVIYPGQDSLANGYKALQAGDVDYARVPSSLLKQSESTYKPDGGWIAKDTFGINYILPNNAKGPMANADARRAVSYAIDRDAISTGVYQGTQTSATALVPPPFKNFFQDGVCDACKHDAAKAKEAAQKGGLTAGTHIKLAYNNDGGHEALVQAWKDQLETTLGVVVDLDGVPFAELLTKEDEGDFDIARSAWSADYPTPDNFLYPLLGSDSGDDTAKYNNPAFDDLIKKERAAKTDAERKPTIQQAEKLAIGTDVALIPTFYRTQFRAFDAKKWTGVDLDFFENPTLDTIQPK